MFDEFTPIKKSLFKERVNTLVGTAFLGTCALWAAMFIWNLTTGTDPIASALATAIESETTLK